MKINWNYIKGFLLLGLILFLFGFSNFKNQHHKIAFVDVEFEQGDNLFMSYEMVNKLLIQNGRSVVNQAKSLIDLNGLEKQVLSHPMVESATAYVTVDGRLIASVKQRTPVGRINSESGSYYIDKLGKVMPLSENYSARVPIITGISKSDKLNDLTDLLSYIGHDEFLRKQIVGIHVDEGGCYELKTRVGDHNINLGKVENLHLKFKNLKAFYNYTNQDKSIEKYKRINLRYDNQVVCTKR